MNKNIFHQNSKTHNRPGPCSASCNFNDEKQGERNVPWEDKNRNLVTASKFEFRR